MSSVSYLYTSGSSLNFGSISNCPSSQSLVLPQSLFALYMIRLFTNMQAITFILEVNQLHLLQAEPSLAHEHKSKNPFELPNDIEPEPTNWVIFSAFSVLVLMDYRPESDSEKVWVRGIISRFWIY